MNRSGSQKWPTDYVYAAVVCLSLCVASCAETGDEHVNRTAEADGSRAATEILSKHLAERWIEEAREAQRAQEMRAAQDADARRAREEQKAQDAQKAREEREATEARLAAEAKEAQGHRRRERLEPKKKRSVPRVQRRRTTSKVMGLWDEPSERKQASSTPKKEKRRKKKSPSGE